MAPANLAWKAVLLLSSAPLCSSVFLPVPAEPVLCWDGGVGTWRCCWESKWGNALGMCCEKDAAVWRWLWCCAGDAESHSTALEMQAWLPPQR